MASQKASQRRRDAAHAQSRGRLGGPRAQWEADAQVGRGTVRLAAADWFGLALSADETSRLPDTPDTAALPRFQRDAAVRLLALLERRGGALLADDVGLGKTHVAAAVIRSTAQRWRRALVVGPASVLPDWRRCLRGLDHVTTSSYARLSRRDPREMPGRSFDLIVADEAHRLRNPRTKRYRHLARMAVDARLLLVTATPIHNAKGDLASLLALLGPLPPGETADRAAVRRHLTRLTVRRTRALVQCLYQPAHRRFASSDGAPVELRFPERVDQNVEWSLPEPLERCLDSLGPLARAALPRPSEADARALLELMLLKRLESSPAALLSTLRRCANYLERATDAARRGRRLERRDFRKLFGDVPEVQTAQLVLPFFWDDLAVGTPGELASAREALRPTIEHLAAQEPGSDTKLSALIRLLDRRDTAGPALVMTSYRDTADYLYRHLPLPGVALMSGSRCRLRGRGPVARPQLLARFAPHTDGRSAGSAQAGGPWVDVLVTTDVMGEGVNLQRAGLLVHYDRPWNPMALAQRAGRIDRLQSPHERVRIVTLKANRPLEARLGLEARLVAKLRRRDHFLGSRRSELGPQQLVELAQVDRDGVLMALAAALPKPEPPPDGRVLARLESAPNTGWLLAFLVAGRLFLVGVDDAPNGDRSIAACQHAAVSTRAPRSLHALAPWTLLWQVATGELPGGERVDESASEAGRMTWPSEDTLRWAAEWATQQHVEGRWAELEPAGPVRSTRRLARSRLARRLVRAYPDGGLDQIERIGRAMDRIERFGAADALDADDLLEVVMAEPEPSASQQGGLLLPGGSSMAGDTSPRRFDGQGASTRDVRLIGCLRLGLPETSASPGESR